MSVVTLVSGGLDSTLIAYLAKEEGVHQHPLFVNYGQRSLERELAACQRAMQKLCLDNLKIAELSGYGGLIRSGLTDPAQRVLEDAFTPGRNLLFLLVASAYAFQVDAEAVSIGLLHEETSIFPDQTSAFLQDAERIIARILGREIKVLSPLAAFHKDEVIALARSKGIEGTYSCHLGGEIPCGACIACNEFRVEEI
ncbi:7-cyano-7-deazaguanine synthase [Rhizobium leguminosarum]|uniref:7-cyano-7-deazaguanine synthase n=1 Tax=Rhizobium leguminosarum TaxID=384 RepID=UPI001C97F248|nr:7-cyano-7-deazaguanine synthase [Rhizobium leguminosarum]MBY5523559.1 7-cyano-7-deazaguanine synthase [Rhizobium leguminosarum]